MASFIVWIWFGITVKESVKIRRANFYLGLEKVQDVLYMMQGMDGMKRQVRIIYLLPGAGEGAGCPLHDARHGRYETPGENHLSIFYLGLEKVLDVLYMMQGMDGMKRQVRIIYISSTWGWRRCWRRCWMSST